MFGAKMESAAICRGCLSTDRKISSLTSNKTYLNLLPNKELQEAWRESEVLVCWECAAALSRMQLFQAQALKAHVVLEQALDSPVSLKSLSTLITCHKQSYDAIFHEIEDTEKPIKKENLPVESGGETIEDYCNDNEDSDHLELDADLGIEEETITKELKVTSKKPLSVLKNKQQTKKIKNNVAVINTKIKVLSLEENEIRTRQMIMKRRPPSSRIKKHVLNKLRGEDGLKKKKKLKRAASPVQFRQGIRKSNRISGIEAGEIVNSNECYVENSYVYVELTKEDNANDCDVDFRGEVDLSILNKGGVNNEKVKANKIDLRKTENANDSSNSGRDNVYTDSKDGESKILEEASGEILEQSEESEEDESNEVNSDDFRKTIVEYHYYELDKHFTKVQLSEDETSAALEEEPVYVTTELPYDCCYCGLCFQLNRTMKRHVRERHQQLRKNVMRVGPSAYYRDHMYRCDHCPLVMRGDHAAAHMKYAHRIRYHCKHCDIDLWNKADCRQHMTTNHSRFDCDLCDETRSSLKLLEKHKRRDHKVRKPKRGGTVQCEECGKEMSSKFQLIGHQEARHPREGSDPGLRCAPCARTLRSHDHYHWHIKFDRRHNPKPVQRFPCPQCGKMFKKYALKCHYNRFHSDKTDFQCKICGKYFARSNGLKYHITRVHLKIPLPKNILCTICGRGFSNKRVLRHHIRTHTGERPFACALCPAAFAQPYPLQKHTATQHKQSLDEVSVESRRQGEEIPERPVRDELIIESQNQHS